MAAELEHDASRVFRQGLPAGGAHHLAHHRMYLEDLSQPAFLERLAQKDDARVVAVHIPHLNHPFPVRGGAQNLPELRQRRARGLVKVDMEAGIHTGLGMAQRIADTGFHRDRLEPGQVEQLFPGDPAKILVYPGCAGLPPQGLIRLADPDHLESSALAIGLHLAGRMRVTDAKLGDADLLFPRRLAGGPAGRRHGTGRNGRGLAGTGKKGAPGK